MSPTNQMQNRDYHPYPASATISGCQQAIVAPPTPQPQIPAAHDRLDKIVSRLHDVIGSLESRLKPVLRVEPCPPPVPSPATPRPISTTIYDKLNDSGDAIGIAVNRIDDLLRLIDL